MYPDRSSCLNLSANSSKLLTNQMKFLPSILKDKNPVLVFLKCMDGFVMAFLKCTDCSAWTHINFAYSSVLSHLRFPIQSAPTRFPQSGNSGVPQQLCKKSNTFFYLKYNVSSKLFQGINHPFYNILIYPIRQNIILTIFFIISKIYKINVN